MAAKIGQALLRRNELLEADLSAAADTKLQSEQQVHHHAERHIVHCHFFLFPSLLFSSSSFSPILAGSTSFQCVSERRTS